MVNQPGKQVVFHSVQFCSSAGSLHLEVHTRAEWATPPSSLTRPLAVSPLAELLWRCVQHDDCARGAPGCLNCLVADSGTRHGQRNPIVLCSCSRTWCQRLQRTSDASALVQAFHFCRLSMCSDPVVQDASQDISICPID